MENNETRTAYKKYKDGDHISDEELKVLIKTHSSLVENFDEINSRKFDLFRNEINSDLMNLKGFQEARKR